MEQTPPAAPAASETPAPAKPFSLAEYRKTGEATPKATPAEKTPAAKPADDEVPDPEVENDPELRAEVDKIEAPKDNETPAEKAARTRRNKEAARKGYATRQKNRADRAEQLAADLRRELDDTRRPSPSDRREAPPAAPRPAPTVETDRSDPEPTLESVTAKYPNDPDPYARLIREQNAWDRRQETRAANADRAHETQRQQAQRVHDQVGKHAEQGRGTHPDYDAKLGALGALLRGHPADVVIAEVLADIPDTKVGSEVLYRAAAHVDETKAAIAAGERALVRYLGRLERDITAGAAKAVPAPIVSAAPAPHSPVQAVSAGVPVNPGAKPGTQLSLADKRKWDTAHGRRSA